MNEITDLGGERLISGVNAFLENQTAGAFFLPEYLGVNPDNGKAIYADADGGETEDYNEALENGRRVLGNPNPRMFGGLTNIIGFGNFELNFTFQFVNDVDIYWETGEFIANSGFGLYGQTRDQIDRWYQEGDVVENPKIDPSTENTNPSSRWLVDGSYIRLNTLSFSYIFPSNVTEKLGLSFFSIYIGGQNLFTITDYPGYDADVGFVESGGGAISQNINRGLDFFTAPQPRIYTTGIKISF